MNWEIELIEGKYNGWTVARNPYGTGLLLLIERGINCADQKDVYQCGTTNPVDEETVKKVLKDNKEKITNIINSSVDLVRNLPPKTSDAIMAIVCKQLITEIAEKSEKGLK